MKKTGFIILAALLIVSSCAREVFPEPDKIDAEAVVTFTAEAIADSGTGVRTTLDGTDAKGYDVLWSDGDRFRLLYKYSKEYSYWGYLTYGITSGEGRTSAVFSTTDSFKSADFSKPAISFYPASMVPDSIDGGSTAMIGPLIWPSEQEYVPGTASGCPMVSTDIDPSGIFSFKNLGGVLRLKIKGSGKITSIRLSADQKMAGSFYIHSENEPTVIHMDEGGNALKSIRLNCGNGISINEEGIDLHINMPPAKYTSFTVEFYDGDALIGSRKAANPIEIRRSEITLATTELPAIVPGKFLGVVRESSVSSADIIEYICSLSPDVAGMKDILPIIVMADLHLASVLYATTGIDGSIVYASGTIAYPTYQGETKQRDLGGIVSIQHGTCDISKAPSEDSLPMELLPAAVGTRSGTGFSMLVPKYFIACMADYLGYGATRNSGLLHPYLHNRLTGSCCADLISATEEFIAERSIKVASDRVDLVGYSQGGAATISTMMELLDRDSGTWTSRIGGVWAGAGPYDIPAFMSYFLENESYSRACYIPYAFRGLAYGEDLKPDWDKVYNSNVGGTGKCGSELETELFSKTQVSTWTDVIGTNVKGILSPDFYADGYNGNADIISLLEAARNNSVANCPAPSVTMKSKIKLYHSRNDDTVPYACSDSLRVKWGLGAITNLGHSDHVQAGVDFLLDFCGLGGYLTSGSGLN